MTYTFTAPRGFIDPTKPDRVERVFTCQQSFNAYIAGLRSGGLHIEMPSPCAAVYVREVRS